MSRAQTELRAAQTMLPGSTTLSLLPALPSLHRAGVDSGTRGGRTTRGPEGPLERWSSLGYGHAVHTN